MSEKQICRGGTPCPPEQISKELLKLVQKAQIDEEQGAILYAFMAKREKSEENKKPAFAVMIATVILIIMFFNYYISVAKEEKFFKNFATMAVISLSVAVISYIIGVVAKQLLGIESI